MRTCKGTTTSLSIAAMTALCTTGFISSTYGETIGEAPNSVRPSDYETYEGGIAGVGFQEAFENGFTYGFGCGQNGWTCGVSSPAGDFEIIDHPDPAFLAYSAQDCAAGHGAGLREIRSPVFLLEPGQLHCDVIINNNSSLFQVVPVNTTTGFFNTRLNFEANGTINALQIQGAPPCTTGVFAPTTGSWTPGVKMRIGVEVLAGNILRVYKNGVQIFSGHDISQFCNAASPAIGISQLTNFNSNTGNTACMVMDNISQAPIVNLCTLPLPFCAADLFPQGGNQVVNIDDLLVVINTWGQNGNPNGPRPGGDCAPGATGDCLVNIDDLLAVINTWGNCPVPTGRCCIQGACSVISQASCAAQSGFWYGIGTNCTGFSCPVPPAGDLCANALTASNGVNNWNNTNANTDGPAPPQSCFPNGGGVRGDVWFKYTATCTGNVTFDTTGTAAPFTDTFLQVFNTHACPPGAMLGCNDDIDFGGNNFLSRASVALTSGQQVLVRCASNSASPADNSGAAVLNITCNPFNNDFCADADLISIPSTTNGSIVGATAESEPNCLPGNPQPVQGSGRWFRVVGNGNTLTASTCPSELEFSWDPRLAVYCGLDCPDLTCVIGSSTFDCGPDGNPQTGLHERVTWCSKAGQSYWILVAGDTVPLAPDGDFTLVVSASGTCGNPLPCGLAPANNDCANAIPIFNGTTSYSTVFATTDGTANTPLPSGVNCSDSGGTQTVLDIWYTYTATCNGVLQVTTCQQLGGATNYDSDLVLYPGNAACPPASSTIIGCNDDDTNNPCGSAPPWASTLIANVTAGQSYILRVGGWANPTDFGTGVLNVSCVAAVCGNGVVEIGEQCDDGNNIPGDGCTNCQIDPNCGTVCTVTPVEACVEGTDTVNGGCNTTPTMYTPIALAGGTAVVCGEAWATAVGTTNTRDLDWYTITVGASGRVEGHITATSLMPVLCFVGTATGPPTNGVACADINVTASDVAIQGDCKVAVRSGLTPGSTALVVAAPSVFTGFPCSGGPWTYRLRIVSP